MIKKIISYIVVFALFFTAFAPAVRAKDNSTLRDYKNELAKLKQEQYQNTQISNATKAEINAKRNAISEANNNIEANEQKVEESKALIEDSQKTIEKTTKDIEDVLVYMQSVDRENTYLKFVMGSNSMTELIERTAIVEQITNYQQGEIERLEKLIKDNQILQSNLADENVALEASITEYEAKLIELQDYLNSVTTIGLSKAEEIQSQEEVIKTFEEAGCKDDDTIDYCYFSKLVNGGKLVKPLEKGSVTQAFGNKGHNGVDLGGVPNGTPMYAAAAGKVGAVQWHTSCGGNIVVLWHNINGVPYTTLYGHMRTINVSVGQTVNANTQIGTVGGGSDTWSYDTCTSGVHLHYTVALGHYLASKDYGYNKLSQNWYVTGDSSVTGITNKYGWKWTRRY